MPFDFTNEVCVIPFRYFVVAVYVGIDVDFRRCSNYEHSQKVLLLKKIWFIYEFCEINNIVVEFDELQSPDVKMPGVDSGKDAELMRRHAPFLGLVLSSFSLLFSYFEIA